jgi:hypothetical protein
MRFSGSYRSKNMYPMPLNFYKASKFYCILIMFTLIVMAATVKSNTTFIPLPSAILPVKLIDVTIKHTDTTLQVKWQDYATDVKEYEIEHAVNGRDFTVLGKIPHSTGTNTYRFEKVIPKYSMACIRIKSISTHDAAFAYSDIIQLPPLKSEVLSTIAVFPNPVKEELFFLDFETYKNCSVKIINNSGAVVKHITLTQNTIQLKKLLTGKYRFQIEKDDTPVAKGIFFKE